jgi:murein DD-endopeptidase
MIFLLLFCVLLSIGWCMPASAQFVTVSSHPSRIQLEKIIEDRVEHTVDVADRVDAAGTDAAERYLSVSYPLDKIVVTSPFGVRADPFSGKRSQHKGLDVRADYEQVYAMMYGEVIKVGFDKRSGNYVSIRHGDYTVTYCHLSQPLVRKGAVVMPGEVVAISGDTGRSTAPHLHISVRCGGEYLNPAILLDVIRRTRDDALQQLELLSDHHA